MADENITTEKTEPTADEQLDTTPEDSPEDAAEALDSSDEHTDAPASVPVASQTAQEMEGMSNPVKAAEYAEQLMNEFGPAAVKSEANVCEFVYMARRDAFVRKGVPDWAGKSNDYRSWASEVWSALIPDYTEAEEIAEARKFAYVYCPKSGKSVRLASLDTSVMSVRGLEPTPDDGGETTAEDLWRDASDDFKRHCLTILQPTSKVMQRRLKLKLEDLVPVTYNDLEHVPAMQAGIRVAVSQDRTAERIRYRENINARVMRMIKDRVPLDELYTAGIQPKQQLNARSGREDDRGAARGVLVEAAGAATEQLTDEERAAESAGTLTPEPERQRPTDGNDTSRRIAEATDQDDIAKWVREELDVLSEAAFLDKLTTDYASKVRDFRKASGGKLAGTPRIADMLRETAQRLHDLADELVNEGETADVN